MVSVRVKGCFDALDKKYVSSTRYIDVLLFATIATYDCYGYL